VNKIKEQLIKTAVAIVVLFVISVVIGWLLNEILLFNEDNLLWMASSLIQAFGAMIAIILYIALDRIDRISKTFEKMWESLPQSGRIGTDAAPEDIENLNKIIKGHEEIPKNMNEQMEILRSKLYPMSTSIIFTIIISVILLMFTKVSLKSSASELDINILYAVALTYLVLLSIYSLYLLTHEILKILNLKFK